MALIEMDGCHSCSLRHEWPNLVTPVMKGVGPKTPTNAQIRVMVVGESPRPDDDKRGEPFSSEGGRFIRAQLGPAAEYFHYTNVVKCTPPKRRPTDAEVSCCTKQYLSKEIKEINPHVIIAVGDDAFRYFVPGFNVAQLRGIPIPYEMGNGSTCWVYPIFDAHYVTRSGSIDAGPSDDKFNVVYPVFKSDINRFFAIAKKFLKRPVVPIPPKREEVLYPQSFEEAKACFSKMRRVPTIDIETSKKKPYLRNAKLLTAAISDGVTVFAFPVEFPGAPVWGSLFLQWLMDSKQKWKAHNAAFELTWFWERYRVAVQDFECTMIKARLIYQRTKILALDTQSQIHLGTPIKDEADQGMLAALRRNDEEILRYPLSEILYYNALDSWSQALLDEELELPEDQYENYARALDAAFSTTAMELYGLPLDMKKSFELKTLLATKMDAAEQEAWGLAECKEFERHYGRKVRLSAPDDVAIIILKYCKLKLPESSQKKYSTDESALNEIVNQHVFVQMVLDHREVSKQLSTYVEPILRGEITGADGLLHPSYTVALTATGRLSSNDPNIQNFPKRKNKEVREQLIPPPGMIMAAFDYGQLEARVLACASRDERLRQSFINKEDIHSKWLNRILEYYPKYFDRLRQKTGKTDEKSLRKAGRDTIKTDFVFASFYGSQIGSVAARTMIPQNIVAAVWNEFWGEYPGVLSWQQDMRNEYATTGTVSTLTGMVRNEILPGNEIINTPCQGTGAHIVIEAQNALFKKALLEDIHFMPRINIHDDLVFFFPDDDRLEQYIQATAHEITKPRFDWLSVPLMTECRVGYNWAALEEVAKFEGTYLS